MSELKIFISHRTADREIADEVRKNLELWGIPESRIFQSSNPASGVDAGDDIKNALRTNLRKTDLFLLVYTTPDQDWSYCMWELGVATANDTKATRVVCISCANEAPKMMLETLNIYVRHDDIKKFVSNMHRSESFVSADKNTVDNDGAVISALHGASDHVLEARTLQLFEDLKEKMPSGEVKTLHRWDYLQICLEPSAIRSVRDLGDDPAKKDEQFNIIKKLSRLTSASQNSALRSFGYQDFASGINLENLKLRWESEIEEKRRGYNSSLQTQYSDWANDLYADVLRAIFNRKAQRTFNYFESIAIDEPTFFRPAVIKAMSLIDDSMNFDVYLYRLAAQEMDLIEMLKQNSGS